MPELSGFTPFLLHAPYTQLEWLTAARTLMNACAAMHDVAIDDMTVALQRADERVRPTASLSQARSPAIP